MPINSTNTYNSRVRDITLFPCLITLTMMDGRGEKWFRRWQTEIGLLG
jgi:hypothetical protein